MVLAGWIGVLVLCSVVISFACDSFEEAADFLGRNMPPGIKGATINAVGSSLPELFTASYLGDPKSHVVETAAHLARAIAGDWQGT